MFRFKEYNFPKDLGLILIIWISLAYYSLIIRIRAMPVILDTIRSRRTDARVKPSSLELEELDKIRRAADYLLTRVLRTEKPCLRRTLVLYEWCCRQGIDSTVMVGVCKSNNLLQGHSWIVIAGLPFREDVSELENYTVMLRS